MSEDRTGEFGGISLSALQRIRTFWGECEPLVETTGYDDPIAPTELRIQLSDGFGAATAGRFDIQWSDRGMYGFHYVDDAVNFRFDRHPNTHSPLAHFHPPPAASTAEAEPSCIEVTGVSLVNQAIHAMWRAAYDHDEYRRLNCRSNPP